MKYNRLGKTNLMVSEVGFGTAQIGGPSLIKDKPFGAKPISDKDAYEILTLAKEAGINFFDSSDMYGDGLAEKRLGGFFDGADDVIFATKCGLDKNGNRRFDRPYVMKTIEGSLRRLKRERIDLIQFAKPTLSHIEQDDLIETVSYLKEKGKIAYAGISVGNIEDGIGFIKHGVWDSLQIIYNLLTLDFKGLINNAFEKKVGTVIRSPLSSGMLTGRFDENTRFPAFDDRSVFMHGELLNKRTSIVETIKIRFELTNEELIIFSLNFLLSDPKVSTIIPGATSTSQMKTNLKVINANRFSQEQFEEVYNFSREINLN
jgi:aryl-alcohol dehydrogenase-like predicted oxidoreductase